MINFNIYCRDCGPFRIKKSSFTLHPMAKANISIWAACLRWFLLGKNRLNAGWNLHTFLLNFDPDLAWWKRNRTNCCISTHFTHSNVTLEYRPAIPSIGVVFSYINFFVAFKAQENVYLHLIMCRAAVLNIQSHANYVRAAISSDSHWILIFSAPCTKIIVVGQVKDD